MNLISFPEHSRYFDHHRGRFYLLFDRLIVIDEVPGETSRLSSDIEDTWPQSVHSSKILMTQFA